VHASRVLAEPALSAAEGRLAKTIFGYTIASPDQLRRMIKEARTCAGKLIVPDLEKAYSGLLIAC
jgi:hypothetical protein